MMHRLLILPTSMASAIRAILPTALKNILVFRQAGTLIPELQFFFSKKAISYKCSGQQLLSLRLILKHDCMKLLSIFFLAAVICFCLSCSFHANNWQSIDAPGENKISFKNFRGKYSTKLSASAGDKLSVVSVVELTEGQLDISVKKKKTTIWSRKFETGSGTDSIQLPVAESGEYQVVVKGKNAAGKFDLLYTAKQPKVIQVITNKNLELFGLMLQLDMGPDLIASKDSVIIENRQPGVTGMRWGTGTI